MNVFITAFILGCVVGGVFVLAMVSLAEVMEGLDDE
jgi:hypothetical protein